MFSAPSKDCSLCPRLVGFRCANQGAFPHFYNGAVPSFGSLDAQLLVVGLAPGLKGANATGRPFTGDYAGLVLYAGLAEHGFARGDYQARADDGFTLVDVRITNAVRCVPPENKPLPAEEKNCLPFLVKELQAMPNVKVILSLGLTSHNAVLRALKLKAKDYKFAHGAVHRIHSPVVHRTSRQENPDSPPAEESTRHVSASAEGHAATENPPAPHAPRPTNHAPLLLFNSYHTSRYNISTGRLTQAMFDDVVAKIRGMMT